ncbi:MAG: histidine kinase dimerization/phospho-acceptor domain-containing protein, partial [Chloroflexota bacterium]
MRGFFFRRVVSLLVILFVFTIGGCALLFLLVAGPPAHPPFRPGGEFIAGRLVSFLALLVGILGIALTGRALRRMAEPVGDLMEAAGRVEAGDFSARAPERGPRELRALARAFNAMTARLQSDEEQRRTLLADVTHELRTPLTVIQGNLEGLLDGVCPPDAAHLTPILEETRVMARLIDDLRTLSQAESGTLKLYREPTELGILIGDAVASFQAQADAAGVELSGAADPNLPLMDIDPTRAREVLSNLIANALRYTGRGGKIGIEAEMDSAKGAAAVSVRDTGAGVPA